VLQEASMPARRQRQPHLVSVEIEIPRRLAMLERYLCQALLESIAHGALLRGERLTTRAITTPSPRRRRAR
jgi:hypothetical protein